MNTDRLSRALLAVSAVILFLGAALHTSAFPKLAAVAASSNLPRFYAGVFQALWLIDSSLLAGLGLAFACVAARPRLAARSLIGLLALIPAAVSAILYTFLGPCPPAHLLLAASVLASAAALPRPAG
ncbi:MAG TPA: hypothetical protein VGE98_13115 [Thermoanaerobaculia bacterium]